MSVTFLDNPNTNANKKQQIIPLLDPTNFSIPPPTSIQQAIGAAKKSTPSPTSMSSTSGYSDPGTQYAEMTDQTSNSQLETSSNGYKFSEFDNGMAPLDDLVSSFPRRSVVFRNAIYPLCDEALEHILESEQLKRQGDFEFVSASSSSLASTPTISAFSDFNFLSSEDGNHSNGKSSNSIKYASMSGIPDSDRDGQFGLETIRPGMLGSNNSFYFEQESSTINGDLNEASNGSYSLISTDSLPNLSCMMSTTAAGMQRLLFNQGSAAPGLKHMPECLPKG